VERRIPPSEREVAGAKLVVSKMGGYTVAHDGDYIGWIHASVGDQWNAYVRRSGTTGDLLGRFRQEEAVRAIVGAWGVAAGLPNRC
jgi:hypothetical protein